jgi:hypothetical protein
MMASRLAEGQGDSRDRIAKSATEVTRGFPRRGRGAGVAELADARDSKSRALYGRVGSTPSSGTNFQAVLRLRKRATRPLSLRLSLFVPATGANLPTAAFKSASLTMSYRSNTERVLCPVICVAVRSDTPALTRFRTAVRLKHGRACRDNRRRDWGRPRLPEVLDGLTRTMEDRRQMVPSPSVVRVPSIAPQSRLTTRGAAHRATCALRCPRTDRRADDLRYGRTLRLL